ncbi:hypothetical protein N7486_005429 [Penicillium sp. IBT 16267x]|nr:hypothetical protein N7486_005429 [Penicillium sp. IBT 16267x]
MLFSPRSSWGVAMLSSLLAATVYASPIREPSTEAQNRLGSTIQPRDPRIIPDTTNYLNSVLDILGFDSLDKALAPARTSDTTETPSSSAASHGIGEEVTATPAIAEEMPTPSSTMTADEMTFTTTVKKGNNLPFENIQVGQGWKGSNRLEASDVPVIMGALKEVLADRFNDLVDSSDELGLE